MSTYANGSSQIFGLERGLYSDFGLPKTSYWGLEHRSDQTDEMHGMRPRAYAGRV